MKFHSVHGCNVSLDESGCRANRVSSFCDGITFSQKPIALNSRVSVLLGANEDWTGALRVGVTSQDPAGFAGKKLPRYACPNLTAKSGFWARPLPEKWVANGNRLTFYVNSKGHFHLFVNSEHKGAVLTGIPVKDQLWVLLDLYGITVSVKFVSNSGSAPSEVVARGPEAVQAYQNALSDGSTSYYHVRLALIGPPDGKKTLLKKLLLKSGEGTESECEGIDTDCTCQTSESSDGEPWTLVRAKNGVVSGDQDNNNNCCCDGNENIVNSNENPADEEKEEILALSPDEEYFKAIALNIVREILLQKKKKQEERRKTPLSKNTFRLQSSLSKMASMKNSNKEETTVNKECSSFGNENMPTDLPKRVVELVESMLKESEGKLLLEKKESEKQFTEESTITLNIWNYSGHVKNMLFHQLFLSPQTIYLFVFDLSRDLEAPIEDAGDYIGLDRFPKEDMTYLSLLHLWLEMIYVTVAHPKEEDKNRNRENANFDIICPLSPPVLIVGVQDAPSDGDVSAEDQFNKIKESIQDKAYGRLVQPLFYCVAEPDSSQPDSAVRDLRRKVEELCLQLPHVGMEIPLKWLLFEKAVDRLLEREVYFADISKLSEVARLENIDSEEEFFSMVHFFHHQGKIWHLGSDILKGNDQEIYGTVILKPQWFMDYVYQLLSTDIYKTLKDCCEEADEIQEAETVVTSQEFERLWPNAFHHVFVLLGMLDTVDLICEVKTSEDPENMNVSNLRTYLIPWLSEPEPESKASDFDGLVLIVDFAGLLPVGFFTKFVVRLHRWSKRHKWKRSLNRGCSRDEIPVDYNHSMKLSKIHGHRIKVTLMQRRNIDSDEGIKLASPSPHVCSKVRHLLERETEHLRDVWYKRLSYSINIPCPCERTCAVHSAPKCMEQQCMHLLALNECLSKKILDCDYRSVKTDFVQRFFFSSSVEDSPKYTSSMRFSVDSMSVPLLGNMFWGDHDFARDDSQWVVSVSQMLTSANTGQDWIALAKRLGYSEREIRRFEDETLPAVSLINNWMDSNGRTRYCTDLLVTCMEQMGRRDIADLILMELGPELPSPPVFISYQWESQESVLHLRRRIELAGHPCWMDVGHLGGGDTLYGKIYEGISKARIVLCCLTPRYVLSPLCTREMSLADVLRKPIVPVMMEPTPWPPPGALALILSSLVYVDLCGIGGHGGCGLQADWESRFHSIIERVSHFTSPSFSAHHRLNGLAADRFLPPPASASAPAKAELENFSDATPLPAEDRESDADAVPTEEEDAVSVASSRDSTTPTGWDPSRRNRVVRCSVCLIL